MQQKVAGLEIAVDDASGMSIVERGCRLLDIDSGLLQGKRAMFCQQVPQAAPWKIRHHQVCQTILFSVLVNRYDVEMFEFGDYICFAFEASKIHRAHPASSNEVLKCIRAYFLPAEVPTVGHHTFPL